MTEYEKAIKAQKRTALEDKLAFQIRAAGLPEPLREYQFHHARRWSFDFSWPEKMIACEVEGGLWVAGRHTRGAGYEEDCIKYAEAVILGWQLLRVTARMIKSGSALQYLEILHGRHDQHRDVQFLRIH